jgi:hypothetical protein
MEFKKLASAILVAGSIAVALTGCGPAMEDRVGTLKDFKSYSGIELNTESNLQFTPLDSVPTDCTDAKFALQAIGDLEPIGKFALKSDASDMFLLNEYIFKANNADEAKEILAEVASVPADPCMNKDSRTTSASADISNLTDSQIEGSFWTGQTVLELDLPAINMYSKTTFNDLKFVARKDEYLLYVSIGNEDASKVTKEDFYSIAEILLRKFGQ